MKRGLLLVAHGSAREGPQVVLDSLIRQMSPHLGDTITLPSFLDHSPDTPAKALHALAEAGCDHAVVVPLLLGAAYHLREDLPRQIGDALPTTITAHLGPHPKVIDALAGRLGTPPKRIVLVASGTKDSESAGETRESVRLLAERVGARVVAAYITAQAPDIRTVVTALRRQGTDDPVLLPYLLSPGRFSDTVAAIADELNLEYRECIGDHPAIADLALERFHEGLSA